MPPGNADFWWVTFACMPGQGWQSMVYASWYCHGTAMSCNHNAVAYGIKFQPDAPMTIVSRLQVHVL